MRSISKYIFIGFLILLSYSAIGQKKVNGTFTSIAIDSFGNRTEEIIKVIKDSIWFQRKRHGKVVLPGERFTNWEGDFRYNKGNSKEESFYSGWLMVMSCDTCPEFWKYTLKSKDSLNLETHVWVCGDTDTTINNRDTTYMTPTIVSIDDPTDLDRVREVFFTFTSAGDIMMGKKIYRRKRKKSR